VSVAVTKATGDQQILESTIKAQMVEEINMVKAQAQA